MANLGTNTIGVLNGEVIFSPLDNFATLGIIISDTWTGTLTFQGSVDGVIFNSIVAQNLVSRVLSTTTVDNGQFLLNTSGLKSIKVKMTSYTSGTATISTEGNASFSGIGRAVSTLVDSNGVDFGTTTNPFINTTTLSFAPELLNGRLFSASAALNASNSGADNPLMLFRNPVASGKTYFIFKVLTSISIANVAGVFKVFGSPVLSSTVANITNITQNGLSTTVTVTTSTNHNATVGATATIAGTVNFNGAWTVASVTSATVYTFTKSAPLFTTTETTGTSTVPSSLGTAISAYALKRVASPAAATGLATSLPTVSSNGNQLIVVSQGQNSAMPPLVDSAQLSLEPGQNMLITADPSSNNRAVSVTIIWSEVPQ